MSSRDYGFRCFLIADDKQFLRGLLHSMLIRCSAGEVRHARDGMTAADALTEACGKIDCVLCDWNMEPMNGLDLLRSIRTGTLSGVARDLCFIMLTGYGDERVVKAAIDLDVNGYVVKPVSMDKLTRAIETAFAKPVRVKAPEIYEKVALVDPPGAQAKADKHIPPWVLLSKMRQTTKEAVSRYLAQIRVESDGIAEVKPLINERYLDIEEIEAGKVLAEHVYSESGRLLLSRGTVLNQALIERLRNLALISHEAIRLKVGDFKD